MFRHLTRFYIVLCGGFPWFRKVTHKWMYQMMAHFIRQDQWTFMNYGYAELQDDGGKPMLDPMDEPNRLSFQLYHHLAREVDLQGKTILEIGCGRGGGASLIKKYHHPEKVIGLDYSKKAIELCKKTHNGQGLSFVEGDAEKLPFDRKSFDAVINVESSHCYASMKRFLSEVHRVLKPGGYFLYADIRHVTEMEVLERAIRETKLKVLKKTVITANVVKALDEDHDRRMKDISGNVPKPFLKQFEEFAGVRDSAVYRQLVGGNAVYISYVMGKGNDPPPPQAIPNPTGTGNQAGRNPY